MLSSGVNYAQGISELEFKTGYISNSYTQSDLDNEQEDGFIMSLAFNQSINKSPLHIRLKGSYKQLGSSVILPISPTDRRDVRRKFTNRYIGISVMSGVRLFENSRINPTFYLGPALEILTYSKLTSSLINDQFAVGFDAIITDLEDETEDLVFGVNLGFGIDWNVGTLKVGTDLRYYTSFTNLYKDSVFASELEDAKHEFFGVMIGFQIPL